ncbi:hypothetical protein VTN77DRAFT_8450 [Rasamsonia byssochlamydoides]|uniref:uncharacterized protein n=1 Tax=Rasamsonia byssochlamydoides TaxID=89139 RepID=UPI003742D2E4
MSAEEIRSNWNDAWVYVFSQKNPGGTTHRELLPAEFAKQGIFAVRQEGSTVGYPFPNWRKTHQSYSEHSRRSDASVANNDVLVAMSIQVKEDIHSELNSERQREWRNRGNTHLPVRGLRNAFILHPTS